MSQRKKTPDWLNFDPTGDTTSGPLSLNDITKVTPSFLDLIGAEPPTPAAPSTNGTKVEPKILMTAKPDELDKQLQISLQKRPEKRRPLLSSQETIEAQRKEILQLKLDLYNRAHKPPDQEGENDLDDIKQDIVAELMRQKEELVKQLEERDSMEKKEQVKKKSMRRDAFCQTNLDNINIEELIKASITLKRQNQERLRQNNSSKPPPSTAQPNSLPTYIPHHRTEHQIVSQLHYPSVSIPKPVVTTKTMAPDEKEILEALYHYDGMMTTLLDKLRARTNSH